MSHYVARYSQNNYYRKRVPISPAPMTELFGDKKILRIFFQSKYIFLIFFKIWAYLNFGEILFLGGLIDHWF